MKATKRIKQLYASKMFWKRKAVKEQRESADLQCDLVTLSLEVTELEAKLEESQKQLRKCQKELLDTECELLDWQKSYDKSEEIYELGCEQTCLKLERIMGRKLWGKLCDFLDLMRTI